MLGVMKGNLWYAYPIISAVVVAVSGVLFLFTGYYYFDGVPDTAAQLQSIRIRAMVAAVLWVSGCGMVSRTRNDQWRKGFLCSLLFLPGLLLLIFMTGGKNRQEIWNQANPGLAGRQLRRQYRDVKPLY
jgi:cell division protein FtsW (lipid II flippase)